MWFGKIWSKTDKQFSKAEFCFQAFENRSCSLPCQHLSLSVVLTLAILVGSYDTLFCISGDQWCQESLTRFYWSLASSFNVSVQFSPHLLGSWLIIEFRPLHGIDEMVQWLKSSVLNDFSLIPGHQLVEGKSQQPPTAWHLTSIHVP